MLEIAAATLDSIDFASYFLDLRQVEREETVVRDGDGWLYFSRPSQVEVAFQLEQVESVLTIAEAHVQNGGWAVGFVGFEAGAALNPALPSKRSSRPLAWFALFDNPPTRHRELRPVYGSPKVELEPLEWDESEYTRRFSAVKDALRVGQTYQVNLTMRQRFLLKGSVADFFAARCGVNPPPYAAYINGGDWVVASFSPELFFERVGTEISSKPMKGTVVRPKDRAAEIEAAKALASDPKSMAENIMIVDMVRNDLGSIAEVGSVKAPRLLEVERHRDLLQMTSTVTAQSSASTLELFRGMFPPASVTGAPKISTCRLIQELEDSPRGIYCGAIGFMAPGIERFNVAIRTAWIDSETGQGEFGIGSGLVWDSEAAQEYAECLAKRDFLLNAGTQWALIEAIPGHELRNALIIGRHLVRIGGAAEKFEITVDSDGLRSALERLPETAPEDRIKVRIELRLDGSYSIECGPSAVSGDQIRAVLASWSVQSTDPNLKMKTTSRSLYEAYLDAHPELDEVLLYNERGEITEFCRGSVVARLDGRLVTPPPDVGRLNGIGLARLVDVGEVSFRTFIIDDLWKCEAIYFVNSVVGLVPVDLRLPEVKPMPGRLNCLNT